MILSTLGTGPQDQALYNPCAHSSEPIQAARGIARYLDVLLLDTLVAFLKMIEV